MRSGFAKPKSSVGFRSEIAWLAVCRKVIVSDNSYKCDHNYGAIGGCVFVNQILSLGPTEKAGHPKGDRLYLFDVVAPKVRLFAFFADAEAMVAVFDITCLYDQWRHRERVEFGIAPLFCSVPNIRISVTSS